MKSERLIEVEGLKTLKLFEEISEEARVEKLAVPPINELLYWWTRKPLVVGRALALLSTIPAQMDGISIAMVRRLIGLNMSERAYKRDVDIEGYKKMLDFDPSSILVMDPFAGQGNLVFEAARLGLKAVAMDYNPVAYLLMKAVLEYPSKYPNLAEDVKKYGKKLIEKTREEIGRFFGKGKVSYIWCWCIKCPYCGQRLPLTNHMWLDRKRKIGYWFRFKNKDFEVEIRKLSEEEGNKYTQKGGKAVCEKAFGGCGNTISYEHMTEDIAERRDKELIAVVVKNAKGKDFVAPSDEDRRAFKEAVSYLKENWNRFSHENLIPGEDIKASHSRENLLWHYGIYKWYEVFTERQLLVMITLLKNIREIVREIKDREYAKAIATYLALMLGNHVDNNCIGVQWNASGVKSEHALALRRPSIVYNFAEVNPFEKTRGSLPNILDNIVEGIEFVAKCRVRSIPEIKLGSALDPGNFPKVDLVITDPPYLDDVQYAEISEFFYVWLYRALKDLYSELPHSVPMDEDISVSWGRFGDLKLAKAFYINGMKRAFRNIYDALKDDGLLVVIFAHSSPEAWNILLEVLREARFRIISSYVVHTESIANVLARGKTSFMSSIVISCRKITEEREAYYESLIPEVESRVKKIIDRIESVDELLEIPITDLLIMSYGKVLEVLTQYTRIKSYDPDFKPDFENLIKDARDIILREIVRKLTGRTPSSLGPETSFLLVSKVFYGGALPADEALKLSKAYGVQIDSLRGFVKKGSDGVVYLLSFREAKLPSKPEDVSRDNIYQQLLFLEKLAAERGVAAVKAALERYDNFRPGDMEKIVSLLVKSYSIKQNKGVKLSASEREEFEILKNLEDVLRGKLVRRELSLLKFIESNAQDGG